MAIDRYLNNRHFVMKIKAKYHIAEGSSTVKYLDGIRLAKKWIPMWKQALEETERKHFMIDDWHMMHLHQFLHSQTFWAAKSNLVLQKLIDDLQVMDIDKFIRKHYKKLIA